MNFIIYMNKPRLKKCRRLFATPFLLRLRPVEPTAFRNRFLSVAGAVFPRIEIGLGFSPTSFLLLSSFLFSGFLIKPLVSFRSFPFVAVVIVSGSPQDRSLSQPNELFVPAEEVCVLLKFFILRCRKAAICRGC